MSNKKFQVLEEGTLSTQIADVCKSKTNKSGRHIDFPVIYIHSGFIGDFIQPFFMDNLWGEKIDAMLNWPKSAKIIANHCHAFQMAIPQTSKRRFQVLAHGSLSEQMSQIIKNGGRRDKEIREKQPCEALAPFSESSLKIDSIEEKSARAEKNLEREEWEYEIAMGWSNLINTFFSNENKPSQEYSIPAFFPTHQWIDNILAEQQWTEKMAEGAWTTMPIATRPISWL